MRFLRVLPIAAGLTLAVLVASPASADTLSSFTESSSYRDSISVNHWAQRSRVGRIQREESDEEAAPRQRASRAERSKRSRGSRIARTADDRRYEAPRQRRRGAARTASLGSSQVSSGGSHHGIASFYWQPQRVASGGWFNPNAMTAAHKTLPFGTRVRVTHLANGRSVVVKINDRGPYIRGRIIDLSKAAAGVIGMQGQGIARVRMDVLGR